jgi:hypothetical protein
LTVNLGDDINMNKEQRERIAGRVAKKQIAFGVEAQIDRVKELLKKSLRSGDQDDTDEALEIMGKLWNKYKRNTLFKKAYELVWDFAQDGDTKYYQKAQRALDDVVSKVMTAKDRISARNPEESYMEDAMRIESALGGITNSWAKVSKRYERQLKDNPESWRGIGRGSELSDLAKELEDVEQLIRRMT